MKHIAVIPARSGSKGLVDKNIKLMNGKPLLAYSIEAARESEMFDVVHVSTDSEKYAAIAREYGADVPFLRSPQTATDTASSWEVVLEVLDQYAKQGQQFDTVTLLQPTSPLRTPADICAAYGLMQEKAASAVVAVCQPEHSPLWCNTLPADHNMDGFLKSEALAPRQSIPAYYRINGALYIISTEELYTKKGLDYNGNTYAYIMPRNRSADIDDEMDFMIAEMLMKYNG